MKIYFWHIDDESEWIAINEKASRFDIVVQIGENYYPHLDCVEYQSYFLKCQYFIQQKGYYPDLDPRTILVKEVTKDCIIYTIKKLKKEKFFNYLSSMTYHQVRDFYRQWYEPERSDMSFCDDWHIVYDDGED